MAGVAVLDPPYTCFDPLIFASPAQAGVQPLSAPAVREDSVRDGPSDRCAVEGDGVAG